MKNFSLQRLKWLIKKQFVENKKLYLLSALGIMAIVAVQIYLILNSKSNMEIKEVGRKLFFIFYFFGLFPMGIIVGSYAFKYLHKRQQSMAWHTVPATALEKLLVAYFYYCFVFLVFYTIVYFIGSCIGEYIALHIMPKYIKVGQYYSYIGKDDIEQFSNAIIAYLAIQAFCILGSAYFKKYHLWLNTICVCLAVSLFFFLKVQFKHWIDENYVTSFFPNVFSVETRMLDYNYSKHIIFKIPYLSDVLNGISCVIGLPWFAYLTWINLKQKQV